METSEKASRIWLPLLMALVFVAAVAALVFFRGASSSDRTDIATNLPLSGALAVYGQSVREGVDYYFDQNPEANERLSFDWQDNASDPATAVRIAARQLEGLSKMPAIYVSGVKPQTMAIASQVAESGLPHFVWIFDPSIRTTGAQNYRTWVSYKIEPAVYLDFLDRRNARKVAISYVQLPHTVEEFDRILLPELRRRGIEFEVEVYEYGRTDFREIANKLTNSNADAIILNGFQLELAAMVRALKQSPNYDASSIIGTYDMLDAAEILRNDEIEGISVVAPFFATEEGRKRNAEWINGFRAKFGEEPLYTHAFAYDMAEIIDRASSLFDPDVTSARWLEVLNDTNFEGVTGHVQFDSDGDLVTPLVIGVFEDGRVVSASD